MAEQKPSFEMPPRVKVAQEMITNILLHDIYLKANCSGVSSGASLPPESNRLLKVSTNLLISYMLGEHNFTEKIGVEDAMESSQTSESPDHSSIIFTE